MKRRSVWLLGLVTAIAVIGAGWALRDAQQASASGIVAQGPLFPQLSAAGAEVTALKVVAPGYTLDMARQGGKWLAGSRGNYPVQPGAAEALIKQLADLRLREAKTSNPDWYSRIDVGDVGQPGADSKLVQVGIGAAKPVELIVGRRSSSVGADPVGATFVRQPGDAQSWLAEGLVSIPDIAGDWFEQVVHVSGPDVQHIAIKQGDATVFDAAKQNGATSYTLLSPLPKPGLEVSDTMVKRLEQGILSVSILDVRPAKDVSFPPDARTIHYEANGGLTVDARLGDVQGTPWVTYSASAPAGGAAAATAADINRRSGGWAFRVDNSKMLALRTKLDDLFEAIPAADAPAPDMPSVPAGTVLTPEQLQQLPSAPATP